MSHLSQRSHRNHPDGNFLLRRIHDFQIHFRIRCFHNFFRTYVSFLIHYFQIRQIHGTRFRCLPRIRRQIYSSGYRPYRRLRNDIHGSFHSVRYNCKYRRQVRFHSHMLHCRLHCHQKLHGQTDHIISFSPDYSAHYRLLSLP